MNRGGRGCLCSEWEAHLITWKLLEKHSTTLLHTLSFQSSSPRTLKHVLIVLNSCLAIFSKKKKIPVFKRKCGENIFPSYAKLGYTLHFLVHLFSLWEAGVPLRCPGNTPLFQKKALLFFFRSSPQVSYYYYNQEVFLKILAPDFFLLQLRYFLQRKNCLLPPIQYYFLEFVL